MRPELLKPDFSGALVALLSRQQWGVNGEGVLALGIPATAKGAKPVGKEIRKKGDHPSHHRPGTPLAGLLDQQGRGRRRQAGRRIRQCHSVVGDPSSQPRAASCHASLRPQGLIAVVRTGSSGALNGTAATRLGTTCPIPVEWSRRCDTSTLVWRA